MARRKEDTTPAQVIASDVVQMALLPDTVDQLESSSINLAGLMDKFAEWLTEGYNLNILWDAKRKLYSARLAGVTEGMVNEGKLLYGNGETMDLALLSLYGKHFLQSGEGEWVATATSGRRMS